MSKSYLWFLSVIMLVTNACSPQKTPLQNATYKHGLPQQARLIFDSGGYYRLSSGRLREFGMQIDSTDSLRLKHKGQQVPFWLAPGSDSEDFEILFSVPETDDRYLNQQVILLEANQKGDHSQSFPELVMQDDTADLTPEIAYSHLVFEEEREYEPKAGISDPFVWVKIDSSKPFEFALPMDKDAQSPMRLLLTFWSPSSAPVNPDHVVLLSGNGIDLGTFEWDGVGYHQIEIEIASLQSQFNLKMLAPALEGVAAQLVYLDSMEVFYDKKIVLASEQYNFEVTGEFISSKTQNSGFLVEKSTANVDLRASFFRAGQVLHVKGCEECSYTWVPESSFLSNFDLQPLEETVDLMNNDLAVDWLVLAGKEFQKDLEPLEAHRQAQGLSTMVIDPQQIYDQFYDGFPHPQALINFFSYIQKTWQNAPTYVLLVGDFDYLRKGYSEMLSQVPSVFMPSQYLGETVSDMPFMDIDNDRQPDFAIGRVPINNAGDLRNWVAKLIRSEDGWQEIRERRIVAIADRQESNFKDDAAGFLDSFGVAYAPSLLLAEEDVFNNSKSMRQALEQPVFLLTYFGHGAINSWGKDQILNPQIINELPSQKQLPIYINMTCLSGYFIHPLQTSLAELLLEKKESGAVTVIAPSSLTTTTNQLDLSNNLAEQIQDKNNRRIGDVLMKSWRMMDSDNYGVYEVMFSFILLGDPAYLLN